MKEMLRHTGICPKCGQEYTGHPALSRMDSETLICPECGTREALDTLGIPYEVHVYSAHRTPDEARDFARNARENGFGVMIAAAGKAAHLAGAIAANTVLPVIGIPIKASVLDGMDALLSTVQMPAGIPVATVAIDGAANAALLAIQILAVNDAELTSKLLSARAKAARDVLEKDRQISEEFSRQF